MSKPTVSRLLVTGAFGLAIALGAPAYAGAADLTEPKATTEGSTHVMKLVSTTTGEKFIPKDGRSGAEPSEDTPPKPGDAFSFTEDLKQDGVLVGTDTGHCTVADAEPVFARCKVTVTFANGTMSVEGEGRESGPEDFRIVGGTGAYAGATGKADVEDVDDKTDNITLTYTISTAAAPADPSAVPSGAPATGGGGLAGNTAIGLVGLAAVAAAAAGGVLAVGRRSG